jgi:hypothetical protein
MSASAVYSRPDGYVLFVGAWGVAIFSNDTASDVRGMFRELIEDGLSGENATAELVRQFKDSLDDPDDGPFFWTGLAAAQHRLGRLQPDVRDRAVAAIDGGADLHLWDDPKLRERRKAVLLKLRAELLGPERPVAVVRRPRPKPSPVSEGQVFALRLGDGREARFRVVAVQAHRMGDLPIVELTNADGRPYQERLELLGKQEWVPAQFQIVPTNWKDLPGEDLRVVGEHSASVGISKTRGYTSWKMLRVICKALLDNPERARIK